MSCKECEEENPCTSCTKTPCKCVEINLDATLATTDIRDKDSLCKAIIKIDTAIEDLVTRITECCEVNNLEEVARGSGAPDNVPTGSDPVIYVRNNGEIWTWNGATWELMAPFYPETESGIQGDGSVGDKIRENFDNLPTDTTIEETDYIVISSDAHSDGAKILYGEARKVNTDSGIQGDGTNANPIKENFDNLPTDTVLASNEYVVVSTAANPDGARILKSDFISSISGVTLNNEDGIFDENPTFGAVGAFLDLSPNGTSDTEFTLTPRFTSFTAEGIITGTTGVINTGGQAKVQLKWNKEVVLNGYLRLTNTTGNNILVYNNLTILLTTLDAKYRPIVEQRFSIPFYVNETGGEPYCQYHAMIQVTTAGLVNLLIMDCDYTTQAQDGGTGGANGFTEGEIWLSGVKYFID